MLRTNNLFKPAPARLLGGMPVGAILKDTRTTYGGQPIMWQIADLNHPGYPGGSVTLASQRILTCKPFDAKEPNNPDANCAAKGCARYSLSNIRAWANSAAPAGEWYVPAHEYDAPPIAANLEDSHNPYMEEAGFLHGFSAKFINSMMPTTLKTLIPTPYGGGFDEVTDKIFLASLAELALVNINEIDEGSAMAMAQKSKGRCTMPTEYCVASSTWSETKFSAAKNYYWWSRSADGRNTYSGAVLDDYGYDYYSPLCRGKYGFRPFCNLPAKTRVSTETDTDGAYLLFV